MRVWVDGTRRVLYPIAGAIVVAIVLLFPVGRLSRPPSEQPIGYSGAFPAGSDELARSDAPRGSCNEQGGQAAVPEELVIVGGSEAKIRSVVADLGGEIIAVDPSTGTYRVRFPGAGLVELDRIRLELKKRNLVAVHHYLMQPPKPEAPQ